MEVSGANRVDIACLPEEFVGTTAEPIPGPTTQTVDALCLKHHRYVICPIREQAVDDKQFNTAVLLDRQGKVAGCYRKVYVFWGEGLNVSEDGVRVFDTDFGRIALLTCFDANFDDRRPTIHRSQFPVLCEPGGTATMLNSPLPAT
ncbi:MAG: carbon-nitrogen hydrolase family protein [Pirellulaceae bacterium]